MEPKVVVGQAIGIVLTVLCVFTPQCKRKWQMALIAIVSNLISAFNFLLLGRVSGCGVATVAIVQATVAIVHTKKGNAPGGIEIGVFGVLYILGGLLPDIVAGTLSSFRPLDALPMLAALLFLGYLSQREEQRMRLFLLGNAGIYLIYDAIILSTQFFAQLFTVISVLIALRRYKKYRS